jgi:hypothetical protein
MYLTKCHVRLSDGHMNAEEFVACWKREKEALLRDFLDEKTTAVAIQIAELNLTPEQFHQLTRVLDAVLTDTMYTLLLGLDGSASIGDVQQTYRIRGEDGQLISDCGDIEAEAGRQFDVPG